MFPQPRVTTADGRTARLDDVLGPGFAVLVRSNRAEQVLPSLMQAPWSKLDARIVASRPDGGAVNTPGVILHSR